MEILNNALWSALFPKKTNSSLIPILKNIAIFEGLNDKELDFIARILHQRDYAPKELIFKQGDAGNGMYIVRKGKVLIFNDETQTEYARLIDGQFFGELSLVDGAPRSASASCTEDTELFGFFKPDLFKVIDKNPHIGNKIMLNLARVLAERLRTTNEQWLECQKESDVGS